MINLKKLLPARTIELGDVIGLVSVYICDRLWEKGAFGAITKLEI